MSIFSSTSDVLGANADFIDDEGDDVSYSTGGFHLTTVPKSRREGGIQGEVVYNGDAAAEDFAQSQLSAMFSNDDFYVALTVKKAFKAIVSPLEAGTGQRTAQAAELVTSLRSVAGRDLTHLVEEDSLRHVLVQAIRSDVEANPAEALSFISQALVSLPETTNRKVGGTVISHDPVAGLRGALTKLSLNTVMPSILDETFGQVIFDTGKLPSVVRPAPKKSSNRNRRNGKTAPKGHNAKANTSRRRRNSNKGQAVKA